MMDFREEYFENKLKHLTEELNLVSKQLMLIQDFIIFDSGSRFQGFCESRRGGRYFRDIFSGTNETSRNKSNHPQNPTSYGPRTANYPNVDEGYSLSVNQLSNTNKTITRLIAPKVSISTVSAKTGTFGQPPLIPNHLQIQNVPGNTADIIDSSQNRSGMPSGSKGIVTSISKGVSSHHLSTPTPPPVQTPTSLLEPTVLIQVGSKTTRSDGNPEDDDMNEFVDESEGDNENTVNPLNLLHIQDESNEPEEVDNEIMYIKTEFQEGEESVEDGENNGTTIERVHFTSYEIDPEASKPETISSFNQEEMQHDFSINATTCENVNTQEIKIRRGRPVGKMIEKFGVVPWNKNYRKLSNGQVICTVQSCHRKFKDLNKFRRHFLQHTGIRPFKCDMCSAAYTRNDQLTRHKQRHAQDQGVLFCGMCNHSFSTSDSYRSHTCVSK